MLPMEYPCDTQYPSALYPMHVSHQPYRRLNAYLHKLLAIVRQYPACQQKGGLLHEGFEHATDLKTACYPRTTVQNSSIRCNRQGETNAFLENLFTKCGYHVTQVNDVDTIRDVAVIEAAAQFSDDRFIGHLREPYGDVDVRRSPRVTPGPRTEQIKFGVQTGQHVRGDALNFTQTVLCDCWIWPVIGGHGGFPSLRMWRVGMWTRI